MCSGGRNLEIETTSLAVLALLRAERGRDRADRAVRWLLENRGGFGEWGATQATVLALKALTAHANLQKKLLAPGTVKVSVNGAAAVKQSYGPSQAEGLVFELAGLLPGKNTVDITHDGKEELPFTLGVEYRSQRPAGSGKAAVSVTTEIERSAVKMGETVRVNATLANRRHEGLPMTLMRVGIPGGLAFQNWQLKELREKGVVAFYETHPREVILYFRQLKPDEVVKVPIDLVANVPGEYVGPASSAYLYYNNDDRAWADPIAVKIGTP
jgi:hypothetical protein